MDERAAREQFGQILMRVLEATPALGGASNEAEIFQTFDVDPVEWLNLAPEERERPATKSCPDLQAVVTQPLQTRPHHRDFQQVRLDG